MGSVRVTSQRVLRGSYYIFAGLLSTYRRQMVNVRLHYLFIVISNSGLYGMISSNAISMYSRTSLKICLVALRSMRGATSNLFRALKPIGIILLVGTYSRLSRGYSFFSILDHYTRVFCRSYFLHRAVSHSLSYRGFQIY